MKEELGLKPKKLFKTFKVTCKCRVRARNEEEAWVRFKAMVLAGHVLYDIEEK